MQVGQMSIGTMLLTRAPRILRLVFVLVFVSIAWTYLYTGNPRQAGQFEDPDVKAPGDEVILNTPIEPGVNSSTGLNQDDGTIPLKGATMTENKPDDTMAGEYDHIKSVEEIKNFIHKKNEPVQTLDEKETGEQNNELEGKDEAVKDDEQDTGNEPVELNEPDLKDDSDDTPEGGGQDEPKELSEADEEDNEIVDANGTEAEQPSETIHVDVDELKHHEDSSNTDRFNVHHDDIKHAMQQGTSVVKNETKRQGRWDLAGLQTEIIEIDGHKIILHHGSNFIMLKRYPVTDDPLNYVLEKKQNGPVKMCTMKERRDYLHQKCQENGWKRWDEMDDDEFRTETVPNLLVDEQHKILFCQSLKKSSTNKWIKFFGIATGQVREFKDVPIHHMEVVGMKGLREYPPKEIRTMLKNFTKLIVVRHPYRRLANLWDDDFRVEGTATRWRLGPKLIQMYHGKGSYKHGDMLSYEDYIKYVTSGNATSYYGIRNFDACKPCLIGYDYIRRIETGPLDSEAILRQMEIYNNPVIIDAEKHHGLRSLTTNIHPLGEVPEDLQEKLLRMYRPDLDLWGYTQNGLKASCAIKREDGSVCC